MAVGLEICPSIMRSANRVHEIVLDDHGPARYERRPRHQSKYPDLYSSLMIVMYKLLQ